MKKKNIVTIGGGTGSFMLLTGLKKYPLNISAIVSMADDGGSTGVLRDELGVLPPGDIRQCLVALSDSTEVMRGLMNYRFDRGGLKGHAFGNIFLSALEKTSGSFSKGVEEAAKILDVEGEVIPVSEGQMRLYIQLKNKKVLSGENHLDHNKDIRAVGIRKVFLKPRAVAYQKAVEKIRKADFIIIGPGDFYGSIVPNFLVKGISNAIKKSKAKVIFNCNLTNKKGQTENFSLEDYILKIEDYIGKNKINFVIFNKEKISEKLIKKYEQRECRGSIVVVKDKKVQKKYKIFLADVLQKSEIKKNKSDNSSETRSFIRHDGKKLAKVLAMIFELG